MKMRQATIKNSALFLAICLLGVSVIGLGIWRRSTQEGWPRLRLLDSSLSIVHDETKLMSVAGNFIGTNSSAPGAEDVGLTVKTRHEALRALLSLQKTKLGIRSKPPDKKGMGIDHVYISTESAPTGVFLRLVATPSKRADMPAQEEDYWSVEILDFDHAGRLLRRQACNELGKQ